MKPAMKSNERMQAEIDEYKFSMMFNVEQKFRRSKINAMQAELAETFFKQQDSEKSDVAKFNVVMPAPSV